MYFSGTENTYTFVDIMSNGLSSDVVSTEVQIKEQAKVLFFVRGNMTATCQEIADFAGVKRTLVNYYFRSRENLLRVAYQEIVCDMKRVLDEVYISDVSFEDKVERLIGCTMEFRLKYPFFEIFNISEISNKMQNKASIMQPVPSPRLACFIREIEQEMARGTIQPSNPHNFLLNLMSLISYPITLKPLYAEVYGMTDEEYDEVLKERKALIKKILFKKL